MPLADTAIEHGRPFSGPSSVPRSNWWVQAPSGLEPNRTSCTLSWASHSDLCSEGVSEQFVLQGVKCPSLLPLHSAHLACPSHSAHLILCSLQQVWGQLLKGPVPGPSALALAPAPVPWSQSISGQQGCGAGWALVPWLCPIWVFAIAKWRRFQFRALLPGLPVALGPATGTDPA